MEKTNVMRILDQKKIKYQSYQYDCDSPLSAVEVAKKLNKDCKQVFKTLVTVGKSHNHYVFVIPAKEELDLRKAAKAVNEKNIEMVKSKELLDLTGYIHGGCSPIGMKKFFPTVIDITAGKQNTIIFSAGRIGSQVELSIDDLKKAINYKLADLTLVQTNRCIPQADIDMMTLDKYEEEMLG